MKPFVLSCDAHIVEPQDLFTAQLPPHLQQWAPNAYVDEKNRRVTRLGETVLFKIPIDFTTHKVGAANDLDIRKGQRDLKLRLADMERDGVDAELCFPSLGLMVSRITDAEAARECCRIYNDWAWDYLAGLRHKLVPVALIPLVAMEDAMAELERIIARGYRAIMMPVAGLDSMPRYNEPAWDPFVALCARHAIPLVFHTGVGNVDIRAMRGPGAAVFNYTRQINDAVDVIAALVGSGVLDRNPTAHILFAECGAGWLLGLAERMDEVYFGHAPAVAPKLSRKPSEIVRDQVHCSFQNDPSCLRTRGDLSIGNFLFATDYPHSEGTFPHSQKVIAAAFARNPDLTETEKAAVLGLNAARLFRLEPQAVYAETRAYLAAAAGGAG